MNFRFLSLIVVAIVALGVCAGATPPIYPAFSGQDLSSFKIILFKDDPANGSSESMLLSSGNYLINAFDDARLQLAPGTYKIAVPQVGGYGMDPKDFSLSLAGYTMLPDFPLVQGAGATIFGAPPMFESIKFG